MEFELTRGEIILVGIIFALIYCAGLLPRLIARLSRPADDSGSDDEGRRTSGGA